MKEYTTPEIQVLEMVPSSIIASSKDVEVMSATNDDDVSVAVSGKRGINWQSFYDQ